MEIYICKYCGKICKNKNSLAQHEIRCKENPNRLELNDICKHGHISNGNQYTKAKELGIEYVLSEETRKKMSIASSSRKHTEHAKKLISEKGKRI